MSASPPAEGVAVDAVSPPLAVLRVYHSGVVTAWRARDAALAAEEVDVVLASAAVWEEAGARRRVARRPGERVLAVPTWGRHPYAFVYDPRPLWRELRRRPLDVLDVHEEAASLAAAEVRLLAVLAGQGRVPFCVYRAQNLAKRFPVPFRWIQRWILGAAAGAHTCNEASGEILAAEGLRGPVVNLGLGVDLDVFAPGEGRVVEAGRLRVGFVGRLAADKGLDVALAAVDGLDGVVLEVVGDGPERPAVRAAAGRAPGAVVDHGPLPPEQVAALMGELDVVVVPSRTTPEWVEQFGRVAVEAMAAGAVVVASDSGSLPEVVGDAGMVLPEGDVAAWRAALERLRDDVDERVARAGVGRRRARRWSWPELARTQAAFYRCLAGVAS